MNADQKLWAFAAASIVILAVINWLAREQPVPWSERQLYRLARLHRWIGAMVCAWDAAIVDYRARMRLSWEPLECTSERIAQERSRKIERAVNDAREETGLMKGTDLWPT